MSFFFMCVLWLISFHIFFSLFTLKVKNILVEHAFEVSSFLFFVGPMTLICVLYVLIGIKLRKSKLLQGVKRRGLEFGRGITGQTRVIRMLGINWHFTTNKINIILDLYLLCFCISSIQLLWRWLFSCVGHHFMHNELWLFMAKQQQPQTYSMIFILLRRTCQAYFISCPHV